MPWYPLAGQVVEPVVHFGGGGHGLTHNPVVSHWLPGTGFLGAPDAKHTVLRQRGGQLGGLGATAPALHTGGTRVSSVDRNVQHATAVNP